MHIRLIMHFFRIYITDILDLTTYNVVSDHGMMSLYDLERFDEIGIMMNKIGKSIWNNKLATRSCQFRGLSMTQNQQYKMGWNFVCKKVLPKRPTVDDDPHLVEEM